MTTPWKTIRVFISSTFKDMQAERDHLVRFVFPRLREALVPHRIHLVDVDLRWGVTSDQNALGVCRQVIDECHPRFMGMLGGRYGWVPEGEDKSITADEIHYGVLSRDAEKRGHAFFYFRDPDATASIVEETTGDFREPDGSKAARQLEDLKRAISVAKLPVVIYPACWDIAQKRFTKLEAFGNRVHDDLLQSLKDDPGLAAHFAPAAQTEADPAAKEFAEEADQMEAFIEERTQHYETGSRQPLLDDMLAFATAATVPNIFVLTGEPGSGKSALLAKFCRSLDEGAPHLQISHSPSRLVLPHFIGANTGSTDLRRTLRRLCHDLALAAGNTEPLPLDIKDLITHFQKLLAEAAGRRRVILVFDALNQFDATDGAHWLNWLPRELPAGVRIVASVIAPADGQPEHQTLAILRARPGTRMEKLEPLTEADTLAVIEGSLRRYAKRLSPEQLAALLAKPAGRLPLYVLTALEELRTLGTYEEITDRIRTLPGDARALFGWILTERLARDPGFRDREGRPCGAALVEKFAACLGVSRHGLSPAELAALLDPGDPLGNVAALLRLLRPYLMRRGELLDFYHGQFREAAEAAHLDTSEKQRAAHQSVATGLQAFADPHRDGQCRDATPHALSELPHHQTRAEAWPNLVATLENIFFLEAKVTHGMTFDLAVDFTAAVDALPADHIERQRLHLLDEALRRDIHFIARHAQDYPQALFQCVWNSAWWYDCPDAAGHYVVGGPTFPCWGGRDDGDPQANTISTGSKAEFRATLHTLLEHWRTERESTHPGFPWLRSLRPPLTRLGAGTVAVLCGHGRSVSSVAFSHNGRHVLSGSWDQTLRMWDAQSGTELTVLRGHTSRITSVAFLPGCRRVLSGSEDTTLRVWDAQSGEELVVLRGHTSGVTSVAFSPDGRLVLSGSEDKTLRVWDADNGRELALFRGHDESVRSVAFSPDGRRALSGSNDRTLRLWNAQSGTELAVLCGHGRSVTSVAFSPDGRRVLSGSEDTTLRVWDAQSGEELVVLRGHTSRVTSVAFSPDGRRVLSGSWDYSLRLWDAQSGEELAVLLGHESMVESVAFSPDGRRVLSGSMDHTLRLWDSQSRVEMAVLRGHESTIWTVAFSPDGHRVLTGSHDKTLRVWDAQSGKERTVLRGHKSYVTSVAFSQDGRRALSGSNDKTLRMWDLQSGEELAVLRGHEDEINSVAFSPDGRCALSRSWNETRVWDLQTGECSVMQGNRDITAADAAAFPWRVIARNGDTAIEATASGTRIAWFPNDRFSITVHPSGRLWAGAVANYLAIFQLEGGPP